MLADINEPLQLPDGSILHPDGKVKRAKNTAPLSIEIPSNSEARKIVAHTRRMLADLPVLPKSANPIAVVLSYTMFGLDGFDIASATGLSEKQVVAIKESPAFISMYDAIVQNIIENESESVRGFFTATAKAAAMRQAEIVANGEDKDALSASNSILDRAGHRAVDVVNVRHTMENILRIEHIVKEKSEKNIPMIDLEVESEN